jgi:hypothetical protein
VAIRTSPTAAATTLVVGIVLLPERGWACDPG